MRMDSLDLEGTEAVQKRDGSKSCLGGSLEGGSREHRGRTGMILEDCLRQRTLRAN